MIPSTVEINLCHDMENLARRKLISLGFDVHEVEMLYDSLKTLFEHELTHIPSVKRKVYTSDVFHCPANYELSLQEFTQKVENGEDLNPFLSSKISNLVVKELLFFDRNICHFHLTRRYNANGKPKRSDYLLFAIYTSGEMYLIQIYRHNQKAVFAQKELLEIICKNWPYLMKAYEVDDVTVNDITDEERLTIRNKHGMMLNNIGDKIYFPPGGGYASDGSSLKAIHKSDYLWNQMLDLETWICSNV